MRKLTTLLMAMLGALALTAASASAADLPYEDADPGHWATAYAVECDGEPISTFENYSCAFSGTADNVTLVFGLPSGPVVSGPCSGTLDYELEYMEFPERLFEVSRAGGCGIGDATREIHICAYDPEGQFDGNDDSIEYWVRDSVSGNADFEPAFAKINEASRSGSVILADEVDYDNQLVYHDSSMDITIDGTYALDEDVYLAPGAECMFSELGA